MFGTGNVYGRGPISPVPDKPSAMEAMVAKMIGFTPEEMAATITGLKNTIVDVRDLLTRVEEKQDQILTRLEALENVGSKRSDNRRNRNASGDAGSDDGGQRNGTSVDERDGGPARTLANTGND